MRRGQKIELMTPDPEIIGSNPVTGIILLESFHTSMLREYWLGTWEAVFRRYES